MDYQEYKRRRLKGEERLALMQLDMLARSFDAAANDLKDRLAGYKWMKRDLGLMRRTCMHLMEEAVRDVPRDALELVLRQSRDYRLGLVRWSPIRREEEIVMPLSDEWQFVDIAMSERCATCLKTEAESKACELRALLRRYVDEPDPEFMSCGYVGMQVGECKGRMNKPKKIRG